MTGLVMTTAARVAVWCGRTAGRAVAVVALFAWLALTAGGAAAVADDAGADGGPIVAGPTGAGPIDAGPIDAGPIDAGPIDAGPIDAGPIDAAATDAGPIDAAATDAAPTGSALATDAGATAAPAAPTVATDAGPAATAPPAPIAGPPPDPAPPSPRRGARAAGVIKLVLGLMAVFALAYIGGHRRVVALEARLGVSGVIAAGFPMIALGVILRQPAIGILTDDVLGRLQPILHFGLGWLGFIIGAQLDIRLLDRVPRGTGYLVVVEALGPFAATAAACAGLGLVLGLADWRQPEFWRDAIVLGAAAAMTAPRRFRGFANRGWREGKGVDHLIAQLDEIVGVIGLLFVAAYFRPIEPGDWHIPGTAWLFVAIGLGVVVGVLVFTMIRVPTSNGEFLAVVLGSVAFGAGLAGYLDLSPTVVCFIAGALVTNFPTERRADVFRILSHLERPIHLLFLVLAGATWQFNVTAPWLVVPAFVVARIVGKWLAVSVTVSTLGDRVPASFVDARTLVSPLSPLAIALVLSLQGSAGGQPSPWLVTVVIGGALLTELVVQLTAPPTARGAASASTAASGPPPTPAPIDELDEPDGPAPIYRDDDDDTAPTDGSPPGAAS